MSGYRAGWMSRLASLPALAFMLLPLAVVVPVSLTSKRYLSMPEGAYSWRHYQALLEEPMWLDGVIQSLLVAGFTSVLATALAVAFALGVWYLRSTLAKVLVGLAMVPLIMPPVVSAMILYFMETKLSAVSPALGYDTLPGVILAHVILVVPFGVIGMMVALGQLDRRLELAARGLGAGVWRTVFWVLLPNLKGSIAATALLAFALSWEEITVTLFITSVQVNTLPRQIWSGLRDNVDPSVAALSVLLIGLTLVILLGRALFAGKRPTH